MFDPLFSWLESSAGSQWIVGSPSLFAFPGILAAHTIGLGLLVGLNAALDLRLLGVAPNIPPQAFARFMPGSTSMRRVLFCQLPVIPPPKRLPPSSQFADCKSF